MATINPTVTAFDGGLVVKWDSVGTADTAAHYSPPGAGMALASVQMTGTFNAVLEASNDGSNWATLKDTNNSDISLTAAGMVEFSTAARSIRPNASSGTVTATVVLRA